MNYEFMQVFLERERHIHAQILQKLANKDEEIQNIIGQLHKLEKVFVFLKNRLMFPIEIVQNEGKLQRISHHRETQ